MSKEKLLALADYIAGPDGDDFAITDYNFCFCGKATNAGMELHSMVTDLDAELKTGELQFARLIMPHYQGEIPFGATLPSDADINSLFPRDQAVRTLRHFAETGTVDWTIGAAK